MILLLYCLDYTDKISVLSPGSTIHVSGIDLINGTPILDIKPFIPQYDGVASNPGLTENHGKDKQCQLLRDPVDMTESEVDHEEKELPVSHSSQPSQEQICCEGVTLAEVSPDLFSTGKPNAVKQNGEKDTNSVVDIFETPRFNVTSKEPCSDNLTQQTISLKNETEKKFPHAKIKVTAEVLIQQTNDLPQDADGEKSAVAKVQIADWIETPVVLSINVRWTNRAVKQLEQLELNPQQQTVNLPLKDLIEEILSNDPRSVYRRTKWQDRLYYFSVAGVHVTAWFDDQEAEILRVSKHTTTIACTA